MPTVTDSMPGTAKVEATPRVRPGEANSLSLTKGRGIPRTGARFLLAWSTVG